MLSDIHWDIRSHGCVGTHRGSHVILVSAPVQRLGVCGLFRLSLFLGGCWNIGSAMHLRSIWAMKSCHINTEIAEVFIFQSIVQQFKSESECPLLIFETGMLTTSPSIRASHSLMQTGLTLKDFLKVNKIYLYLTFFCFTYLCVSINQLFEKIFIQCK